MKIALYISSRQVQVIEADSAKKAWRKARSWDQRDSRWAGFYTTANRAGFAIGDFRATPVMAHR